MLQRRRGTSQEGGRSSLLMGTASGAPGLEPGRRHGLEHRVGGEPRWLEDTPQGIQHRPMGIEDGPRLTGGPWHRQRRSPRRRLRVRGGPAWLALALVLCLLGRIAADEASSGGSSTGHTFGSEDEFEEEAECHKDQQFVPETAEEFVQRWISSPSSDVCGHWQFQYAETHKDIRSGAGPKKYITFQNPNNMPKEYPRPGLGDYLVGMATTFVVALLTDRAFVMEDSALTEIADVGEINWHLSEDVPMHDGQDGLTVVEEKMYNSPKIGWHNTVIVPKDALEYFAKHDGAANIRMATNGGVLTRIFNDTASPTYLKLHSMGLRLPTAFGCIIRYILRPKKDVWKTLIPQVEVMRRPRNRVVGIHMRTTDDFAWGSGGYSLAYVFQKADETVLQCARDTADFSIADGDNPRWLFLSDSRRLRKRVQEKYGDMLVESGFEPLHVRFNSSAAMGSILAEWLLLTMCDFFVVTESGFAKTAVAYNINMPKMFLFSHFQFDQAKGQCDQARPSSLFHFHRWSGL